MMLFKDKPYTDLITHVFDVYIRGCLEPAHDCCIICSRSVSNDSETFEATTFWVLVHKSDGTDKLNNCKNTQSQKRKVFKTF